MAPITTATNSYNFHRNNNSGNLASARVFYRLLITFGVSPLPAWTGTNISGNAPTSTITAAEVRTFSAGNSWRHWNDTLIPALDCLELPAITISGGPAVTEGTAARFTLTASPVPTASLTVNLTVTESGDAVASGDKGTGKTVTIGTSGTATYTVPTVDDTTLEANGSIVTVTVTSGTGYRPGSPFSAMVTVSDDDKCNSSNPCITVTGTPPVTEGPGVHAVFTIHSDPAPSANLPVTVAIGDRCYFVAPGDLGIKTITINSGQTSATHRVPIVNDNDEESKVTSGDNACYVSAEIRSVVGDGYQFNRVGTMGRLDPQDHIAEIIVIDDDNLAPPPPARPTVSISADTTLVTEGTAASFTVTASPPSTSALTVNLNVTEDKSNGHDFVATSNLGPKTVTIPANQGSATHTVPTVGDSTDEPNGSVTVTVDSGTGYTASSTSGSATVAINDDDGPAEPAASFAAASSSATESAGTRNVRVNLSSAAPSGGLTLSYSVGGNATAGSGNDFTIQNSGTLSVAAGATSATIPVAINDDSTQESTETVILTLTGGTGYTLGSTRVHTLTINDNDTPRPGTPALQFSRNTLNISEGGTGSYTVRLATQPTGTVTVNIASGNAEVTVRPSSLTFNANGSNLWNSPQTVTVSAAQDDDSNNDSATLTHSASGGGYGSVAAEVTVTVNDDDGTTDPVNPGGTTPLVPIRPSITIRTDSTSVPEGTDARFTVLASTAPTSALTISLRINETTAEGQDFIDTSHEGPQTLTLDAGATSAAYSVPTVDDTIEESDGQVMVTVEPGTDYSVSSTSSSASVTITDNDHHEITFASGFGRIHEGGVHATTIHIDPAPSAPLTLRYRLSGTATEGEHYRIQTTTPGEIQIPAGSTRVVVRVQSLVDEEADSGKTVVLHFMGGDGLSLGAVRAHVVTLLAGAAASLEVGRGWLVRFGRTVAEQGLDSIAQRLRAPRSAGTRVSLGGTELAGQDARQEAQATHIQNDTQAYTQFLQNPMDLHTNIPLQSFPRSLSLHEVLQGSHFMSVGETDAYGGSLAFWGRAAHSSFDGKENRISLDGDSTALLLGADYARGPWLGGITLSHSEGDGDYRESGTPGDIEASLTSLLPWLSLQATERLQVWGALGIGEGDMHLEPEGGEKLRTDIDWALAGVGVRSALLSPQGTTGLSVSLVGDVLWMETDADRIGGLSVASAGVSRARLGLEGQYAMTWADGTRLIPRLELGVREDEGDAENGAGVELGGGLAWSDPHRGLTLELAGRTLITHDSNDLEDRGISVSLDYDPMPGSARGLSLSLHQAMGTASTGGLEALFASEPLSAHTDPVTGRDTDQELESRLRLEAAYGLVAFEGRFIAGPRAALSHSPAVQDYSLGWRLVPSTRHQDLSVQITALRREHDREPPEHATTLEMIARW